MHRKIGGAESRHLTCVVPYLSFFSLLIHDGATIRVAYYLSLSDSMPLTVKPTIETLVDVNISCMGAPSL